MKRKLTLPSLLTLALFVAIGCGADAAQPPSRNAPAVGKAAP